MIFNTNNIDFDLDKVALEDTISIFKNENPHFLSIFLEHEDNERIREEIYHYFYQFEIHCLQSCSMDTVQKHYSQEAIQVLKNIFSTRNEYLTHFSVIYALKQCMNKDYSFISVGFMLELLFLLRALKGINRSEKLINIKPTVKRAMWRQLDQISQEVKTWLKKYPNGLDEHIIKERAKNQEVIKAAYQISEKEWKDWEWHKDNLITDVEVLENFIELSAEEKEVIKLANEHQIPFGITPYYLSLFRFSDHLSDQHDHSSVRAQAIPSMSCINKAVEMRKNESNHRQNRQNQLPPEISITRGYPMIAIFKPMQTNSRFLCLYGERNWEANYGLQKRNAIHMDKIDRAIRWFERHSEVTDVLIAGDILVFDDIMIEAILSQLADISHIQRIRVTTRIPIILPIRITDTLIHLLSSYQITGRREISLMTHFEHSYEVTLEAMNGIQKLRKSGIHVYNQSIYTMGNARRFEMTALRKQLRLIGVDPYYSFNTQKEIAEERVPIARMIQEQNEESRLAPGIDRADEAVFNIPGVGKNYLKASQEHELIMILADGSRIYEFYPSDVYQINKKPFLYRDISLYSFLSELAKRGEDIKNYQSIWYYY